MKSAKDYLVAEFPDLNAAQKELLSALLPAFGFEGIEETETALKAYIPGKQWDAAALKEFLEQYNLHLPFSTQTLPDKNWNEAWEKSYEPVVVAEQVLIKTSFHPAQKNYPFEILIDPQMSFGTGHHETTQLMLEMMLAEDFENKSVLDFGSGTGVLSILAHKMNAKSIVAIDMDEWAYRNIMENLEKNHAQNIQPLLGGAEALPAAQFQIILANVNKNILLGNMKILASRLINHGTILFSGLLLHDETDMAQSAGKNGLILLDKKTKNEWLCLKFSKQ